MNKVVRFVCNPNINTNKEYSIILSYLKFLKTRIPLSFSSDFSNRFSKPFGLYRIKINRCQFFTTTSTQSIFSDNRSYNHPLSATQPPLPVPPSTSIFNRSINHLLIPFSFPDSRRGSAFKPLFDQTRSRR
ncbi:hypothetical protein Hanom_Chr12g01066061 [Helianthus anomalus]